MEKNENLICIFEYLNISKISNFSQNYVNKTKLSDLAENFMAGR